MNEDKGLDQECKLKIQFLGKLSGQDSRRTTEI